jgi:ribosomal-protein-alanine N-acetyltransferase
MAGRLHMAEPAPIERPPADSSGERRADAARAERVAPVTVRLATAADVDRVSEIENASFTDPWSWAAFQRLVAERDTRVHFAVACTADGTVAGYVVAWFVMDEGEIANLAVAPEARAKGIGATLLRAAIMAARVRQVTTLYLEVRDSNTAARALYASHGFMEVGRRRRYYRRPVEDALVLRLVLPGA